MDELKEIAREIQILNGVAGLLAWDQETYMPLNGAYGRSQHLSLISTISHERLIAPKNLDLLREAREAIDDNPQNYSTEDVAFVREFTRSFERASKLPPAFVSELSEHTSKSLETWKLAREQNNFSLFLGDLEKIFELKRQEAEFIGYMSSPYDALLDDYEPGMTESDLETIFEPLKKFSIDLVKKIQQSGHGIDDSILSREFDFSNQEKFCRMVVDSIGYNVNSGRVDISTHPFTTEFGTSDDVRITIRFVEGQMQASFLAAIHEAGHALYEQGVSKDYNFSFLAGGTSLGIHESQSRMWENFVAKSPEFWDFWYPRLLEMFPTVLGSREKDDFIKALNVVKPSLIRVEADEVTYNLHIMLRFELERLLIKGELDARDAPDVWNEKMQEYFGIRPGNFSEGILQDIHWAMGGVGYFPTYTLGNIYAAQFWHKINQEIPDLQRQLSEGIYAGLLTWLRNNIHVHGKKYTASELCNKICGEKLNSSYLTDHLSNKYSNLYKLI